MKDWEKTSLAAIGSLPGPGTPQWPGGKTLQWTPARKHFGIRASGINVFVAAQAGDEVVEQHTETARKHEERSTSWPS